MVKSSKKKFLIAGGAALAVCILIIAIVATMGNAPTKKAAKLLAEGDRYLSELDYERAVAAYEAVIAIDPKCEEAYLALSDIYMALNDPVKAVAILDEGYAQTESEVILTKRDRLAEETRCARLGHEWTEATCTEAKYCDICGEKEGEPLGHTMAEADYWSPAVCTVCEMTEGEPLTPSFVANGLECIAQEGVAYEYVTACGDNSELYTVGQLTFSDYEIFEGDETHPAEEGYEWRKVHAKIVFNDTNARRYGCAVALMDDDYYDYDPNAEWKEDMFEAEDEFTITYKGVEYPKCTSVSEGGWGEWEQIYLGPATDRWGGSLYTIQIAYDIDFAFRVPADYDGIVAGCYDYALLKQKLHKESRENAIMFRLQ